ncbi:MAG: shikimate kinase [Acidimicrobiales bacterium]|jgi:shikimate kinase
MFTAIRPHVVVLGLMGVGKSTTAQAIAIARGVATHDSDVDIETLFGATGGQLAIDHSIDELHRVESAVLLGRLASETPSVISAAASIVEDPRCCEALARRAHVIVLQAPVDEIMRRMATGLHRRIMKKDELTALAHRRAPFFAAVANLELDATKTTQELVAIILA